MGFMKPQVARMQVYMVDTNAGTYVVPIDVLSAGDFKGKRVNRQALLKYTEGTRIEGISRKTGWFSRLSAPGYDSTEWSGPFKSRAAAVKGLREMYPEDDEDEDYED